MAKSRWEDVKDKLFLVECWARDGLDDKQIAHNLGVGLTTFYKFKKEHPEFCEALKKGKEVADYEVENALYKRATGYDYTEERVEISPTGKKTFTQTVKHIAPDTAAAFIWLKNRRPDKWRDKPQPDPDENANRLNQGLEALADILGRPVPNRKLEENEK